jgi:hypothetical protein
MVALANLTVAPGDRGRQTGDVGCDTEPPSGRLPNVGSSGDMGERPVILVSCPGPGLAAEVERDRICLGGGRVPSGLDTRRIDFGIGGGGLQQRVREWSAMFNLTKKGVWGDIPWDFGFLCGCAEVLGLLLAYFSCVASRLVELLRGAGFSRL